MTIKMPVLVPDRNSASGFRVEYLDCEIDAKLAAAIAEPVHIDDTKDKFKLHYPKGPLTGNGPK